MRSLILIVALAAVPSADAQNLVRNGTFDHDLSEWFLGYGDLAVVWTAEDGSGSAGSGSVKETWTSPTESTSLVSTNFWQDFIRVTGGRDYVCSARVRLLTPAVKGIGAAMWVMWWDANGNEVGFGGFNSIVATSVYPGWTTIRQTMRAPQSAVEARVLVGTEQTNGFSVLFDDVSMVPAAPPPTANFTWTPIDPVAGESVQFTDTSTGSPDSWTWTFSDQQGTTASLRNPVHVFHDAGTYTVGLTVATSGGTDTATKTITVSSATCHLGLESGPAVFPGSGGGSSVRVRTTCPWTVTAPTWVHVQPASGTGDALITYTIDANTSSYPRSGTVAIAGAAFQVVQRERSQNASIPVLFLHGYCSDAHTWDDMIRNLQQPSASGSATRYAGRVDLYYDGVNVRDSSNGGTAIVPAGAYTIGYYSSGARSFDQSYVKDLRIEQLAWQAWHVIAAIRYATNAAAVDLVAHSMGGLVSRALVEGFAWPGTTATLEPYPYDGTAVRRLVTIDTPHGGAAGPKWGEAFPCAFTDNVQARQMDPDDRVYGFLASLNRTPIPRGIQLTALVTTPFQCDATCIPPGVPLPHGDGVVTRDSQDIKTIAQYACVENVRTHFNSDLNVPPVNLSHVTVHKEKSTARLIDALLTNELPTASCRLVTAQEPLRIRSGYPRPSNVSIELRFPPAGGVTAAAQCTATVTILRDAVVFRSATVPSSGYQYVSLRALPPGWWDLEVRSTCPTSVTVSALIEESVGRQRSVRGPAAPCVYTAHPSALSFTAEGGVRTLGVSAGVTCPWVAAAGTSWLRITAGLNGTGDGAISVAADPNPSTAQRTTIVTLATTAVMVTQSGASVNRVKNAGFEDGLTFWGWDPRYEQGAGSARWVGTDAGGNLRASLLLTSTERLRAAQQMQCVPITPGERYAFGGWYQMMPTGGTALFAVIEYAADNCAGTYTRIEGHEAVNLIAVPVWNSAENVTTAGPGSRSAYLVLGAATTDSEHPFDVRFDDVFVRPEP